MDARITLAENSTSSRAEGSISASTSPYAWVDKTVEAADPVDRIDVYGIGGMKESTIYPAIPAVTSYSNLWGTRSDFSVVDPDQKDRQFWIEVEQTSPYERSYGVLELDFWLWSPTSIFDPQNKDAWVFEVTSHDVMSALGEFSVAKLALLPGSMYFRAAVRAAVVEAQKRWKWRVSVGCQPGDAKWYAYQKCTYRWLSESLTPAIEPGIEALEWEECSSSSFSSMGGYPCF